MYSWLCILACPSICLKNSSGVITCLALIDKFTLYCDMLMKKFPLIEFRVIYFAATHKTRFRAPVGMTSLVINVKTHKLRLDKKNPR